MSIFDRLGRSGKNVPSNASFRLTQEGREKLQNFKGDAKSRVLVALETEGTSNVNEIASAAGLSKGKVEGLIASLIRGGYVQYISGGASNEEG